MYPCGHDHTEDGKLLSLAEPVVLGVVKARQDGNAADAALMINGFLRDAVEAGFTIGSAWALLFSASTIWVDALVAAQARINNQSPAETLSDIALTYAKAAGR